MAAGAGVESVRFLRDWTPFERQYLLAYVGTEIAGTIWQNGWYTLLEVVTRKGSRLALDNEVVPVVTDNGEKTFALTNEAVKEGALRLEWRRALFENGKLHAFLGYWIYHDQTLFDLVRPALWTVPIVFLIGLWPAIWVERKRISVLRCGRKLRGPDLITVTRFNWRHRRSRGICFGNEDRTALERMLALNKKLHIPFIKENRRFESMRDTATGKTQLIIQQLLQIEERNEIAIVHDPEREYTPRFYRPERGDVILFPCDQRMPFHACLEPFCCVVQSRHFALIGCKPNGTTPFLRREFAFQFSREVSESCEFCCKQFSNVALLSLADRKNITVKASQKQFERIIDRCDRKVREILKWQHKWVNLVRIAFVRHSLREEQTTIQIARYTPVELRQSLY